MELNITMAADDLTVDFLELKMKFLLHKDYK